MSLLQQVIQLLSQSPGNVIYHLVTLFALQAIFAISLNHWRRNSSDHLARRMAWAAGAIFVARLLFLFISLALNNSPLTAVAILPPLEEAIHTATALLVVYALIPYPARQPRLGDTVAVIGLIFIGVLYLFFAPDWYSRSLTGEPYNGTWQAAVWGFMQMAILGAGLLLTLGRRRILSLSQLVIGLLLLTHVAHFWNYPEIIASDTDIAYWIRLGHLVIFPLWAVLAYRHSLGPLLVAEQAGRAPAAQLAQLLHFSTGVISPLKMDQTLAAAIDMASRMIDAVFVGIAVANAEERQQLHLISNLPQTGQNAPRSWNLNLADWPAFRLAMEQKQLIELRPDGLGARQLHDWYQEMGIGPLGALLAQPLLVNGVTTGLLLLAGAEEQHYWPEHERVLAPALADYVAQAIENVHRHNQLALQATAAPVTTVPEPDTIVTGQLIALEAERDHLLNQVETTHSRLLQAEARAAEARKQARDLAAAIQEMERQNSNEQVEALEAEIEALRESLVEAEEAMAMASAGIGGLSTEWVMHTITRYSGQLEEAQARIQALETELTRRDEGPANEVLASLAEELRTPMTSIAGYTDLLLGETMGILGIKQRDFLQRVKANVERLGVLLVQIVQLTTAAEQVERSETSEVQIRDVIEGAVSAVITQIREKNLRLDLDIGDNLPSLPINRHALHQIMINLLGNACQSSPAQGRIAVSAYAGSMPAANANGRELIHFMHLAVTDSGGGISVEDRTRVFDPQYQANHPLIAGLGDTGAALAVARTLVETSGGRIWADSDTSGTTFSVLLPLSSLEMTTFPPELNSSNMERADEAPDQWTLS